MLFQKTFIDQDFPLKGVKLKFCHRPLLEDSPFLALPAPNPFQAGSTYLLRRSLPSVLAWKSSPLAFLDKEGLKSAARD